MRTTFSQLSQFGSLNFKQHGQSMINAPISDVVVENGIATFKDPDGNTSLKILKAGITYNQEGSGDPSLTNIRPIEGYNDCIISVSSDVASQVDYEIDWENISGAIYGGILDVINGILTVTHCYIEMDGTETWTISSGYTNLAFWRILNELEAKNNTLNGVFSHFKQASVSNNDVDGARVYNYSSYARILIRFPSDYADAPTTTDEMKAWVKEQHDNNTPFQIVYEMANPITVEIDPVIIKSLIGNNTVEMNNGAILELE